MFYSVSKRFFFVENNSNRYDYAIVRLIISPLSILLLVGFFWEEKTKQSNTIETNKSSRLIAFDTQALKKCNSDNITVWEEKRRKYFTPLSSLWFEWWWSSWSIMTSRNQNWFTIFIGVNLRWCLAQMRCTLNAKISWSNKIIAQWTKINLSLYKISSFHQLFLIIFDQIDWIYLRTKKIK